MQRLCKKEVGNLDSQYINENLYSTSIEVLKISACASNCLESVGYITVGKLVEKIDKREDLKNLRNCSEKNG